ncbi:MAG: target of Sbf [Thelocarpon impressellum]|nr:MAG: target of Sbf [Thelocarpon impressellum]
MRYFVAAGAVLAATLSTAAADNCGPNNNAPDAIGNFYCAPVKAITYTDVTLDSTYHLVTNMDPSGKCQSVEKAHKGALSPLDEDVSIHFKGPLHLKQFAVYYPKSNPKSAATSKQRRSSLDRRHGHQHFHEHNKEVREVQERELQERGDQITATINGKVVSWAAGASATPAPDKPKAQANYVAPAKSKDAPEAPKAGPVGDWARAAYYDAKSQKAEGLVFLNNLGGQGSGVFDNVYGNSLSYAGSDGASGASSPQVLADTVIKSNSEVTIFSNKTCQEADCGYYRPGTVAYYGFSGANKIFLMEFSMPEDGTSGWNSNMPAAWMLNGKIPRTAQYPMDPSCSCWKTGCGEFDLFEVLDSGNTKCKSTFHFGEGQGLGDSDYFQRPTGEPIQAAVIMDGNNARAHIQVLDKKIDFSSGLTSEQVEGFFTMSTGKDHSQMPWTL